VTKPNNWLRQTGVHNEQQMDTGI